MDEEDTYLTRSRRLVLFGYTVCFLYQRRPLSFQRCAERLVPVAVRVERERSWRDVPSQQQPPFSPINSRRKTEMRIEENLHYSAL